jgi:hypothetical protein
MKREILIFIYLVISHHYGKEGRDSKQIESKGLLLDFELFQNMSGDMFILNLTDCMKQFVKHLNTDTQKGNSYIFILYKL